MTNEELLQSFSIILNHTLDEKLAPIRSEIAVMKGEIASMKDDVSSLKNDVASMKGEIASMKDDISSLKNEVASMKDDISTLKNKVASMNSVMVTKSDLTQSENLILVELSRTHNIMLERTDKLRSDLDAVKQSVASVKSNNEYMTLLLGKIDNQEKRVANLEKEFAHIA